MKDIDRFTFIGHALRGDGPFRPTVTHDGQGNAVQSGLTYLIRYPRENDAKFARRNEVAFYESPLHRSASRFVSHISKRAVSRDIKSELMVKMAANIDLKGNSLDVFWQDFMLEAKARGSMLLLVDSPNFLGESMREQIDNRRAPYWTSIDPARVKDYTLEESGKFQDVTFRGTYYGGEEPEECLWYFDTKKWECKDKQGERLLAGDDHNLGETPVLIFTEAGDYPCFGPFAAIADLAKRLFNLDSELDEILRAQTFSLLTMPVPDGSTATEIKEVAQAVGETIGTNNMMAHTGSTPAFIAPPDGPAEIYMKRIDKLDDRIREIGLDVSTPGQKESGIAMLRRFEKLNAELAKFSERTEDLERRAWALTAKWLGVGEEPMIAWPRDFDVTDIDVELDVLDRMETGSMPDEVLRAQRKKVVATQFDGMDESEKDELLTAIDNQASSL